MRFLLIPTPAPNAPKPATEPAFDPASFNAYMRFNEELFTAGVLFASEGLNPAATSAHVKVIGGKRTAVDGPFAETKELVAGFWLIEVASRQEAIDWAMRAPVNPASDEIIEIRQLTGEEDLPKELVEMIRAAAPTWAAAFAKRT